MNPDGLYVHFSCACLQVVEYRGSYKIGTASESVNAAYIFSRKDLSRPAIQIPCASKAVVAVRFCPIFFNLKATNSGTCALSIVLFTTSNYVQPVICGTVPIKLPVFAQGSQQLSQKIGSQQKNKRDLPVTSLPKKGAFVPRYQISLETLVDSSDMATAGAIRLLDMEEDIFGYSCTETIGKEDLEHIFRHQELGVGVIHTYIRFLYDNFMRGNDQLSNRFRFVSSSLVNKALICREPDSCREYLVKRFMASSTNNLYLWPYNSGCHWLLLAIDPLKEVVYFLNSIDGEWTNYPDMKQLVDTSIKVFRSQRQARVPRTKSSNITWIKVVLYSATVSIADTL
ncbi:hypothetical protein KIW84_021004 [Lathyrus oleraceus]|uniref:Ubiquitin-like protease family profile domain-containing protein n=1 Tax=Pisum sativum TaxID=3888 RepID=A0A9D4Y8W2_PEA|nr:hypothetical protein KIW84_021004 [Pisum sativum]